MTTPDTEWEKFEHLIDEEVEIKDGGFVNPYDAERYFNTGYDMELILKRFREMLTSRDTYWKEELQKARQEERGRVLAEISRRYWLNPKRSKSELAKENAWNDLGNTLRRGV